MLGNFGIDEMIVMVQKEVALKMTGIYKNPLLLMIKDMGTIEYLFTVNKMYLCLLRMLIQQF